MTHAGALLQHLRYDSLVVESMRYRSEAGGDQGDVYFALLQRSEQ